MGGQEARHRDRDDESTMVSRGWGMERDVPLPATRDSGKRRKPPPPNGVRGEALTENDFDASY